MSGNAWITRDDVLNDLREVNGRNTGAEYLEQYVVRGEAPPPVRQELTDDDEIQYRFGGPGTSAGEDFTPDLKGISLMLKMVDDLDPVDSSETKTLFRDTTTEELCISKMNPHADEFVPGQKRKSKVNHNLETSRKVQLETKAKFDKGPILVRKSDNLESSKERFHENCQKITETIEWNNNNNNKDNNNSLEPLKGKIETSNISDVPNGIVPKELHSHSSTSIPVSTKAALDKIEDISFDLKKMKCDEIEAIKEKIKSKINSSSQDNSLKKKREKNVAIAALLKLCTAPRIPDSEDSVKLVTPDYFEVPPIPAKLNDIKKSTINETDVDVLNKETDRIPDTSSSANQNYVDPLVQESISKVNDWFNNTGSPKPKPQAFDPAKEPVAFKKKTTPSPSIKSTPKKEVNSEKKNCGDFVPSSYANDLLHKYQTNARKKIVPKEDLGTMLERELKERDQQIKKKLLEKRKTMSPGSGRSEQ